MEESNIDETSVLLPRTGVPLAVRDNRQTHERKLAVYLILASTIFERLAFYSLAINLVVTLKSSELNWSSATSTTVPFIFFGTSYISTLIFAGISDAKLGRSKTIIIGFILYFIGYLMIILISNDSTHEGICGHTSSSTHTSILSEHCGPQIIGTLIFMAIGVGAVQVNMAVFGAEQIQESKLTSRYFDKYYIAVNIGASIGTLSIPLIQNGADNLNDSNSYFYGYVIAIIMLVGAALLFIVGRRYYIHVPPYDSVLLICIPVIINAFQTWRKYHNERQIGHRNRRDSMLRNFWTNRNTISQDETTINNVEPISFLDYANAANNGKFSDRQIDDVRSVRQAIIVFLLLIPYWIIYYQTQTTFQLQGEQMYIPTLMNDQKIPVSWMSLGDSVAIILGITILLLFVYKYFNARERLISIKIKLVIGMALASLTMCLTGAIEGVRQKYCPVKDINQSNLSIYWQLPQNICMGFAEIFATVASLEFAYLAAPRSAQSLLMSLQFSSVGISSFLGKAYLSFYSTTANSFDFTCVNHTNRWTLTTYFFILAGIQAAFIVIIVLCDNRFQILKLNPQQIKMDQFEGHQTNA